MVVIKKGKQTGLQRYQCKDCKRNFQNKPRKSRLQTTLWKQYIWHRQTIKQLAVKYHKSIDWVRRHLDRVSVDTYKPLPQSVVAIADITFFGRGYGILVFRSQELKQNLYWTEISTETKAVYQEGRNILENVGLTFDAVVLDGRIGLKSVFSDILIQFCQFHQIQIVSRYLTKKPKLEASIQLRLITLGLCKAGMTEQIFSRLLKEWHGRWEDFLKERTYTEDEKHWQYTHKRVRSAYRSLKNNLPYLFTYQKYPELKIPNTTNSLDGSFSHLKDLLRIHRGIKRTRRWKMIQEILTKSKH